MSYTPIGDTPLNLSSSVVLSDSNNSTTLLTNGSTFTGTGELNGYTDVMVFVATDQNGILYCEFSTDGTNWDTSLSFNYNTDRINPPHIFEKGYRYYRTRFTNDSGSDQTYLRLQTYFGSGLGTLTAPINGTLAENYDATVVRPTDYHYEVALGKRQGRSTWNKFGYNEDVDTGAEEIIGSFGGTFNVMTSADTLEVVSDDIGDKNPASGAHSVFITGIDGDNNEVSEIVTMNGTSSVTTTNSYLGVNRIVVLSSGTNDSNDGTITVTTTIGTFGTQAEIPPSQSVTQQCIFHTPINHTFLSDWLVMNARKLSGGGGSPRVTIKGYSYSRVTETVYEVFRYNIDTSVENTVELSPAQPFAIGGREVLYFTAETNTNNTTVSMRFSGILERLT